MKMRKTMWAVCLAALMPISAEAVAATSYDEPQQKENTQKKEIPNPEKTAGRPPLKKKGRGLLSIIRRKETC